MIWNSTATDGLREKTRCCRFLREIEMNVQIESWEKLALDRVPQHLAGHAVPWVSRARQSAYERFVVQGFPTRREEEWKYTDVAAIGMRTSHAPDNIPPDPPSEAAL